MNVTNSGTSSAESATIGDTSWARFELVRFSTSLRIQDRAEFGKYTELNWGRGHCTEKETSLAGSATLGDTS